MLWFCRCNDAETHSKLMWKGQHIWQRLLVSSISKNEWVVVLASYEPFCIIEYGIWYAVVCLLNCIYFYANSYMTLLTRGNSISGWSPLQPVLQLQNMSYRTGVSTQTFMAASPSTVADTLSVRPALYFFKKAVLPINRSWVWIRLYHRTYY